MKKSEEMHLKCVVYESTLSTADAVPLPQWGRQRGGGFAAPKGSQPRLAALGSPFQGKGLAWTLPPSYGRRCPEGAEVRWGKRYEREREDRLKQTIYESTRAPLRGPPSPMGKATIRGCGFSRIVKANTGYVEKKNNDGQSLPLEGKVASGASRIGQWRYEREWERS